MIPALTECDPGFEPTEYNIVIAPETADRVTPGGIILTEKHADTQGLATMRGRLVAVSPLAFNFDNWPQGAKTPGPGDEVIFAKYAGTLQTGEDGREYRLCKDKDVIAVVRPKERAVSDLQTVDTAVMASTGRVEPLPPVPDDGAAYLKSPPWREFLAAK